ncbi:MAG: hypothetical protein R3D43_03500 [Tepidamorphaceae bacterium]
MAQTAGRIQNGVFRSCRTNETTWLLSRSLEEYEKAGFTAENMLLLPFEWISQTPDVLLDHVDKFLGQFQRTKVWSNHSQAQRMVQTSDRSWNKNGTLNKTKDLKNICGVTRMATISNFRAKVYNKNSSRA